MFLRKKDKIRIRLAEDPSEKMPEELKLLVAPGSKRLGVYFMHLGLFFLFMVSVGTTLNQILGLELGQRNFVLPALFLVFWALMVYLKTNLTLYFLGLTLIGWGIHLYRNWEAFISGGKAFLNCLFSHINSYYGANIPYFRQENYTAQTLSQFFTIIFLLLGFLLSLAMIKRIRPPFVIGVGLFCLLGGLMLGRLPNELILQVFFLCFYMVLAMNNWKKNTFHISPDVLFLSGLITGGVFLFSLMLSVYFIAPEYSPKVRASHKKLVAAEREVENMVLSANLYYELFQSGRFSFLSDDPGSLGNQAPRYTGAEALRVTVECEPDSNLYLKGWVGSDYNGKGWDSLNEQDFYQNALNWSLPQGTSSSLGPTPGLITQNLNYAFIHCFSGKTTFSFYSPADSEEAVSSNTITLSSGGSPTNINIIPLKVNQKFTYAPYFCKLEPDSIMKGDGYISQESQSPKTYLGYPFASSFPDGALLLDKESASEYETLTYEDLTLTDLINIESSYLPYLKRQYTKIPEGFEDLEEWCRRVEETFKDEPELGQESYRVNAITAFITQYLHAQARYSTQLSSLPIAEDFVKYFLYEEKRGFCTHFASTATLMYRMFGIPARYASGYVVRASDFRKISDNEYEASVPDSNSHAWVEIYIKGFGWTPIEVTPGYSGGSGYQGGSNPTAPIPVPTPGHFEGDLSPNPGLERPTPSPQAGTSGGGAGFSLAIPQWLKNVFYFILTVITLYLLLVLRRTIIITRQQGMIQNKEYGKAVSFFSHEIYDMLRFVGYARKQYISDLEYGDDMALILYFLPEDSFEEFISLAQKIQFSEQDVNHNEFASAHQTYRKIASRLGGRQEGIKKFYWKYIRCFQ